MKGCYYNMVGTSGITVNNPAGVKTTVAMPQDPEVINSLRRLGLNEYEARAYFALSSAGKSTAGELSERAELPRPRIYDVLDSLLNKGFAAMQTGRPVTYSHLPLGEALGTLRKQRYKGLAEEFAEMDQVGRSLESKLSTSTAGRKLSAQETAWTLKGREAAYSKMGSMISGAKSHILISTTPAGLLAKTEAHGEALGKARARGVKLTIVSPVEKHKAAAQAAKVANELKLSSIPTRFVVSDDQALIFLSPENTPPEDEITMWLNSPHFASTLRRIAGA